MKAPIGDHWQDIDSWGALAWADCSGRCACGHTARGRCANCLSAVCATCAQVIRGRAGDQAFCTECRILDFSLSEAEAVSLAAMEIERLGCVCGDAGWLYDKHDGRVFFVTLLGTRRCPMRPTTITGVTKASTFGKALRRVQAVSLVHARRDRPHHAPQP
jgi:hypothetical protein